MDYHFAVLTGIYTIVGIGVILALFGSYQVWSFLKSHNSINDQQDFDLFKSVVKTNMQLAIILLVLAGLIVILILTGFSLRAISWPDLKLAFFIMGPVALVTGILVTSAEQKMKKLPLNNETFRQEFKHVVESWGSSLFPDW